MGEVFVTLPYPPSVNHYWRHVRVKAGRGAYCNRVLISEEGRRYRQAIYNYCTVNRLPRFGKQPIDVVMLAHPPDNRRRDIDNLFKSVLDALAHAGIYDDDSQITRLSIEKAAVIEGGALLVSIKPGFIRYENIRG